LAFRIYVVDDNPVSVQVLADALIYAGFSVVTALNGLEALQQMRRQTPDLIILDVGMPIMDGFALAHRITQDPRLAGIPLLFLTAATDFHSKAEGFGVGADDYVAKPFERAELVARVRAILRRREVQDSPERDIIRAGDCALDVSTANIEVDGRSVELTAIESDLMRRLMLSPGEPLTAQQLLVEVLDYPPDAGDPSLIRWHIRNMRQKIENDPAHPVHLQTHAKRGYSFH
jgi:DNA-binding response OmpR family regulator